jgi:hypothetical protein
MSRISIFVAIGFGVLISPLAGAETPVADADICLALRIAERYMAVHYPKADTLHGKPIVEDKGDMWVVAYQSPPRDDGWVNIGGWLPVSILIRIAWSS